MGMLMHMCVFVCVCGQMLMVVVHISNEMTIDCLPACWLN